ncbi:hypothetical protein ACFXAF_02820 [Kitasatospora sp. NPDC059463]|uniref:hypothetical protein n=1 Tax=unclassified Kitasatospora TaxID=2633591 RepID=UPI0036C7626D
MLADLGPHAARYADRPRALAADNDRWDPRQGGARALGHDGDCEISVPAMTSVIRELADGTYYPVMLPAVRHRARVGHAADGLILSARSRR